MPGGGGGGGGGGDWVTLSREALSCLLLDIIGDFLLLTLEARCTTMTAGYNMALPFNCKHEIGVVYIWCTHGCVYTSSHLSHHKGIARARRGGEIKMEKTGWRK